MTFLIAGHETTVTALLAAKLVLRHGLAGFLVAGLHQHRQEIPVVVALLTPLLDQREHDFVQFANRSLEPAVGPRRHPARQRRDRLVEAHLRVPADCPARLQDSLAACCLNQVEVDVFCCDVILADASHLSSVTEKMPAEPYLIHLSNRLFSGLKDLEDERRRRHRDFILSHQLSDGGFCGREGDSDLYYTSFAVRSLAMLGELTGETAHRVFAYLETHKPMQLSIVDLLSWLSTAVAVQLAGGPVPRDALDPGWADQIAARLESVRTKDGGYAKNALGAAGSTYQSFLVVLSYELIGRAVPRPNALVQFLYDRQRDDGGFVEIAPMKRSGTNPTAAAVAVLDMLGALDDELRADVRDFLRQVKSDEGGFQANTRIPFADGLSTFTGLLTLSDLKIDDVLSARAVRDYLTGWLEFPTGGFRGASWDEQADVEYTFYGLGNLALIAGSADA